MLNKSICLHTIGCRLNQAETAVLRNKFIKAGFCMTSSSTKADVVVINTCTVTKNSDLDCVRFVKKVATANPKVSVALIGCQSQLQNQELAKLPRVKWIIGNAQKMNLAQILSNNRPAQSSTVDIRPIPRKTFIVDTPGIDPKHTRANIKIQDGCDFFCSFCEVPFARGRARSRDFNNIIAEARELACAGHKELVITGINVGTYQNQNKNIVDVIKGLEQISDLKRIRVSSIEPTTIPKQFTKLMTRKKSKLCRHLHVPLQSGDNKILKLMKRKYCVEEFKTFIESVNQEVKDICLGVDVMVGFPQEGEDEFQSTYDVLSVLPIHYLHVFSYSDRRFAKSRLLTGHVDDRTVQLRSKKLRQLSLDKRTKFYQKYFKKPVNVLFEQKKNGWWTGLTDNFIHVKVQSNDFLQNEFISVKLDEIESLFVKGKIQAIDYGRKKRTACKRSKGASSR